MEDLRQKLTAVIDSELPKVVGQELSAELARLYKIEDDFARQNKRIDELLDREREFGDLQTEAAKLKAMESDLIARHSDLERREIRIELEISKVHQAAAEKSLQSIYALTTVVFRNQMAKKSMFGSDSSPGSQGYGAISLPKNEVESFTLDDV